MAVCILVAAASVGLSRWQYGRLERRRAANAAALAARTLPVLDLSAGLPIPAELEADRRIRLRGTFDPRATFVLRGRAHRGTPGVHVASLFHPVGNQRAVLIDRGFVPAPDAVTPDAFRHPPPDTVTIQGYGYPLPAAADSGQPIHRSPGTTWARLDAGMAGDTPIADVWLLEQGDTSAAGWPLTVEPAPLTDGPHLNYAIQWLAIGATALVFGIVYVKKGLRT